jgi:ABC-type transporter Mla subunit MlaD
MELTKEHFDQAVKNLATNDQITELTTKIEAVQETLATHGGLLDAVAKNTQDWNTELVAVRARLDRHDQWFKQVSEKLNLKLTD